MARPKDSWIHSFTVTDYCTHKKGYTIYKITSIVFPAYLPEALTCLTIWKRFNDIKKLYKDMVRRHKELHLRGTVPDISDTDNYFHRFDVEMIEKRKKFILNLLDFIAQHSVLYRSHAFISFFDGTHTPAPSPDKKSTGSGKIQQICESNETPCPETFDLIDPTKDSIDETPLSITESIDSVDSPIELESNQMVDKSHHPPPPISIDTIDMSLLDDSRVDYIYEAAIEFSHAVQAEVYLNYREAFDRYKNGIDILLTGSKTDRNETRKGIAKEKTKKYLQRAEEIYEKYVETEQLENNNVFHIQSNQGTDESVTEPMERPINQLSRYKVIKIFATVMQVQDVTDKKMYIMKAIQKVPVNSSGTQSIFLPQNCPFMVRLITYFQSDTTIYLLLQQASGGKLWDYIRTYKPIDLDAKRNSTSLASIFSEPGGESVHKLSIPFTEKKPEPSNIIAGYDSGFNDLLTSSETSINRSNSIGLNYFDNLYDESDPNNDIPPFDCLSDDMDVLDLVSCSQKLLKSVSVTLEQVQDMNKIELEVVSELKPVKIDKEKDKPKDRIVISDELVEKKISPFSLNNIRFPETTVKRWASEIVAAICNLHGQDIILYDLAPDNILLGGNGDVMLTYFYRHESDTDCTRTGLNLLSVDRFYVAPERPLSKESDWWSFGVLLFELLTGQSFVACHPAGCSSYFELQYPDDCLPSDEARDLLQGLIQTNPETRFNSSLVQNHSFFRTIDWKQMISSNLISMA